MRNFIVVCFTVFCIFELATPSQANEADEFWAKFPKKVDPQGVEYVTWDDFVESYYSQSNQSAAFPSDWHKKFGSTYGTTFSKNASRQDFKAIPASEKDDIFRYEMFWLFIAQIMPRPQITRKVWDQLNALMGQQTMRLPQAILELVDSIHSSLHKYPTEKEIKKYLDSKPDGAYLIRFSLTYPGAFIVEFVLKGKIYKYIITPKVGGGYTVKKDGPIYSTMAEAIKGAKDILSPMKEAAIPNMIPVPGDFEKIYQIMKSDLF